MSARAVDPLAQLRDVIEASLARLAEADMDAREEFSRRIQMNEADRRAWQRTWRMAGLGDPPAYKAMARVVREVEAVGA